MNKELELELEKDIEENEEKYRFIFECGNEISVYDLVFDRY